MYARHGHELMGWKSPVGVSELSMLKGITTSRRQGRNREGASEGSLRANVRADEQKSHRRPSPWVSQHKMTKPNRNDGQGKCGVCARKVHVLIRGELPALRHGIDVCPGGSPGLSRTRRGNGRPVVASESAEHAGGLGARVVARRHVRRQQSAETVVVTGTWRRVEQETTRRSREPLALGAEPDRGSRRAA